MNKAKNLLMNTFDFTDEDLEANQYGYLTDRQRQNLRQKFFKDNRVQVIGWLLGGAVLFLLLFAYSTTLAYTHPRNNLSLVLFCIGTGLSALTLVAGFAIFNNWRKISNDIHQTQGDVRQVCGEIELKTITAKNNDRRTFQMTRRACFLIVQGEKFRLTETQFRMFNRKQPYCIYYTPRTKYVLSVKLIQTDD